MTYSPCTGQRDKATDKAGRKASRKLGQGQVTTSARNVCDIQEVLHGFLEPKTQVFLSDSDHLGEIKPVPSLYCVM